MDWYTRKVVVGHRDEFEMCAERIEVLTQRRHALGGGMHELGDRPLGDVGATGELGLLTASG